MVTPISIKISQPKTERKEEKMFVRKSELFKVNLIFTVVAFGSLFYQPK